MQQKAKPNCVSVTKCDFRTMARFMDFCSSVP